MRLKRIASDPVESKGGSATRRGKPGPGSIFHRTTAAPECASRLQREGSRKPIIAFVVRVFQVEQRDHQPDGQSRAP